MKLNTKTNTKTKPETKTEMSDNESNGWDENHHQMDDYDSYYDQDQDRESINSINSSLLESLDNDIIIDETNLDSNPIKNLDYCIGLYFTQYDVDWNATEFVLMQRITNTIFYKYPSKVLEEYLIDYSGLGSYEDRDLLVNNAHLEIIQIHFEYPIYTLQNITTTLEPRYGVVSKTIWLKLIQKEWKKHYAKTKQMNEEITIKRGLPSSYFYFETHGRYPYGLNYHLKSSLKGLMYLYAHHAPHSKHYHN